MIFRGGTAGTIRETDGDGFNGDWARGGIAGLGRAGGLELRKAGGARRGGDGAEGVGVLEERFLDGSVGAGRAGGAGAGAVGLGAGTATGGFGGTLLGESPLGTEGGLPNVGGFPTKFRISQDDHSAFSSKSYQGYFDLQVLV